MNLAHIAETKFDSKLAMDQAEARTYLIGLKINETEDQNEIERLERMKLKQIGIASRNRQTYMEMLYLSARLSYADRLKLKSVKWS